MGQSKHKTRRIERYLPAGIALLAGAFFALLASWGVRLRLENEDKERFDRIGPACAQTVRTAIESEVARFTRFSQQLQQGLDLEREATWDLVESSMADDGVLRRIEWAPGGRSAASHGDDSFRIRVSIPRARGENRLGLDLRTLAGYGTAIARAEVGRGLQVTGRIDDGKSDGTGAAVALLYPISSRSGRIGSSPDGRAEQLRGFVVGTLDLEKAAMQGCRALASSTLGLYLFDLSSGSDGDVLFPPPSRIDSPKSELLAGADSRVDLRVSKAFDVAGRKWVTLILPGPSFFAAPGRRSPWRVMAVGLMLTGLLCAYLLVLAGRADRVEKLVSERTAELIETNAELHSEVVERRRAEVELAGARNAALESAEVKSKFLATMSHEIRTPLNGVIGMSNLLLDTDLDSEQRDYARTVKQSAGALLDILNDILDFSKIEAGKLSIERIGFDLRATTGAVMEMFAPQAASKGIELACLIHAHVPDRLVGDPGRLRQLLINLVGNAIKFTDRGEVVLRCTLESWTPRAASLRFSVTDTGIGIAPDKVGRLFRPYSQAEASTARKFGGTGLGLTICKQLIDLMEGRIGLESNEGKGSTFWFTLEFERETQPAAAPPSPEVLPKGLKVLVVTACASRLDAIERALSSAGCQIEQVKSQHEAMECLLDAASAAAPFRVVFVDDQTPGFNAESLGAAVFTKPSLARLAMVVMTSLGQKGDARRMADSGYAAYLTAPIDAAQLLQCLSIVLGEGADTGSTRPLVTRHSLNESTHQRRVKILLAEDNEVNQKVASRMLEKLGYACDIVDNGLQAVEALGRERYDLVLMDCQMPEMDGYEAAREIRRRFDGDERVPIVALTANAMKGDRERCLDAGMDDFLSKPFSREKLQAVVLNWTSRDPIAAEDVSDASQSPPSDKATLPSAGLDAVIDLDALDRAADGDKRFACELIEAYLGEGAERMERLRAAAEQGDSEALSRAAHALKGASGYIGALGIMELAVRIERHGSNGDLDSARQLLGDLTAEWERVRQGLEKETER